MNDSSTLTDKDLMLDALCDHKGITAVYNYFSNESWNADLREQVLKILKEEHDIQADIFTLSYDRGWYPIEEAQSKKINEAFKNLTEES